MLTMKQKEAVTKELRDRYQRSSKKGKTHILNEFIQLTRYNWTAPLQLDTFRRKIRLII